MDCCLVGQPQSWYHAHQPRRPVCLTSAAGQGKAVHYHHHPCQQGHRREAAGRHDSSFCRACQLYVIARCLAGQQQNYCVALQQLRPLRLMSAGRRVVTVYHLHHPRQQWHGCQKYGHHDSYFTRTCQHQSLCPACQQCPLAASSIDGAYLQETGHEYLHANSASSQVVSVCPCTIDPAVLCHGTCEHRGTGDTGAVSEEEMPCNDWLRAATLPSLMQAGIGVCYKPSCEECLPKRR